MSEGAAEASSGRAPLFLLRPYCAETDAGFVRNGWLASNRYAPASHGIPWTVYELEERPRVAAMLHESTVTVAHAPGDVDALMGFAAWARRPEIDRPIIHYVYVAKPARRLGIARAMLEQFADGPAWITHLPVVRTSGKLPIPNGWRYFRYLIEGAPR